MNTTDPRDAEIAQLTAENAALREDLNDARSNWESGAEELRQADAVRERNSELLLALQQFVHPYQQQFKTTEAERMQIARDAIERAMAGSPAAANAVDLMAQRKAMFQAFSECVAADSMLPQEIADRLLAARSAAVGAAAITAAGHPIKVGDDGKRDVDPHYGKDCPVGMVQVEFVGADPKARISDYGWKPTKSAFLDIYVDGQRFNITVGDICGREERGLHIVTSSEIVVDNKCVNALDICYKTQCADDALAAGVTP